MSLLVSKLGALAAVFFSSLLLGLLPFPLRPWLRNGAGRSGAARLALSCLQCLGGGVLLATVLTHMLPEIREGLAASGRGTEFPLAEVLLCAGMFSIYAVEELAMLLSPAAAGDDDGGDGEEGADGNSSPMVQRSSAAKSPANGDAEASRTSYGTVPLPAAGHGHSHGPAAAAAGAGQGGGGGGRLAAFRVLIVTAALSVHSVFEGVAIGLEASEPSVWLLTAAIATHKSIIAFCLGEQLAATQRRLRAAVGSLLAFVSASPLGICIGLLVTSTAGGDVDSQAFATDVLQALAAGTILYVVLFEIIQTERTKPGPGLVKLAAILAGFGIMLLVGYLVQEPDEAPPAVPTVPAD